jgi:hypothetical protein
MRLIEKFKRDIAKHRGRAVILGILFVTMIAMSIRAALELRGPRTAVASGTTPAAMGNLPHLMPASDLDAGNAQAKIEQSRQMWSQLRTVSTAGMNDKSAFAFDGAFYPAPVPIVDLSKPTPGPEVAIKTPAPQVATPAVEDANLRLNRVRDQARALVVKSTAVGNGTTEPMAIVNQQLVTVGQKILGFEVTAIRSREVEFVKEGVTVVGKMPDGQ